MSDEDPELSVIIPTLNEAESLPLLIGQLRKQTEINLEVIVIDAFSDDGTQRICADYDVRLIESKPGRGHQMNQGAEFAKSPLLLFLHADSSLSSNSLLDSACQAFKKALERLGNERLAGHFRLKFQRSQPGHDLAYHYYEAKSALNRPECTNGDQGLLITASFFRELRGFDESLWFLEDQRLAESIRQRGLWMTLPGTLGTSARRFEQEGLGRRMLLSAIIMNFHAMGLHEFFHRARNVYRRQDQTEKLRLGPIYDLIHAMNKEAGSRVSRRRWVATGRYAMRHIWQLFFWLDVAAAHVFGLKQGVFLPFYDRYLHVISRFRPFHYLAGVLTWCCFSGIRLVVKLKSRKTRL